jgi:hypothetical protein
MSDYKGDLVSFNGEQSMSTKTVQMPRIERKFRCPYCPRTGVGTVAIDVDQAVRAANKRPHAKHVEVDIPAGDPSGIILFAPDRPSGKPCEHVISLLIDVEVRNFHSNAEFETLLSRTGNFDHPWFAENDPDKDLNIFLWTDVNGGDETAFHPVSPFRIHLLPSLWKKVKGTSLRVLASGTIIVAMQPLVFLEELREGFGRCQKFYAEAL